MPTSSGPKSYFASGCRQFSSERAEIDGEDARKSCTPRYLVLTAHLRACRRCASTKTAFAACSTRDSKQLLTCMRGESRACADKQRRRA
eukprot:4636221-Pleurochrysis_carterae.AAC.1